MIPERIAERISAPISFSLLKESEKKIRKKENLSYVMQKKKLGHSFEQKITVFIRLTALGAYYIFSSWEWALTRGGRLFEAGRLLNFHHFQQV